MTFSTIAVKLQLVMPKTNKKNKIGDQKSLLANFIFLKVISNIRDTFGANHFTSQIIIMSAIHNIKKKIFWHILIE